MERENLNALIDRVMGGGGILRTPVYWMKKVLKSIVEYHEGLYRDAANEVNKKAEVYTLPKEGKYATNSATGKKLLDIINNPDKYMIQRLVDYSGGEILVPCHIYRIDNVTDSIRIESPAWHTSTGTTFPRIAVDYQLTSYRGVISKGIDGDYIEINYEDNGIWVLSINLDTEMSDISIWPVQNKVIKKYVDDAVSEVGAEVVDNLESDSTTAALSANQGRVLKEYIDGKSYPKVNITVEELEMQPNTYYTFTGSNLALSLVEGAADMVSEYVIKIVCTGTPNIILPDGLVWANDTAPEFTEGVTYQISIIDNLAVFAQFTTAS